MDGSVFEVASTVGTTLSGPDVSSRDVIFTGRGLSVFIAVSYDGGGDSDTELRNSRSLHPGPTS